VTNLPENKDIIFQMQEFNDENSSAFIFYQMNPLKNLLK